MTQKTNKATVKTASSTIKITLTDDITLAGNPAAKGETIAVDKITAEWLIKLNKAQHHGKQGAGQAEKAG